MNKIILSFLTGLCLTVSIIVMAQVTPTNTDPNNPLAKAFWSNFDGERHALLTASYDGENWSDSQTIHESDNPMTSIAIGSADNNAELLVWTEQVEQKSQLFHKWFSNKTETWSEAQLLSNFGTDNIGATIVVDPSQRLHLLWSANKTDFTDIVHMSYANGDWSKIQTIHDSNDVPDIQANASLDISGNVLVTWSSYSSDAGQYVEQQVIIETDQTSQPDTKTSLVDAIDSAQIPLPDFLPNDASATIYFPQNSMTQSAATTR